RREPCRLRAHLRHGQGHAHVTATRGLVLDPETHETELRELELADPQGDQVRVRIRATGVCHSDLHMIDGDWPADVALVLGHEGAGVVEAVGPAVHDVEIGDHVALSWFAPCRRCEACAAGRAWLCSNTTATANTLPDGSTPLRTLDGEPVFPFLGVATFADCT